jgi:hypothetical protein
MLALGLDHSDDLSDSKTLDDLFSDIDFYVDKELADF